MNKEQVISKCYSIKNQIKYANKYLDEMFNCIPYAPLGEASPVRANYDKGAWAAHEAAKSLNAISWRVKELESLDEN